MLRSGRALLTRFIVLRCGRLRMLLGCLHLRRCRLRMLLHRLRVRSGRLRVLCRLGVTLSGCSSMLRNCAVVRGR